VAETASVGSGIDTGGLDTVLGAFSFSLKNSFGVRFVENLVLTGSGNTTATGNALANRLTGYAGNNVVNGGPGSDVRIGGAGNDTFIFNSALDIGHIDRISVCNVVEDTINLDDAILMGLLMDTLAARAFPANATGLASAASD